MATSRRADYAITGAAGEFQVAAELSRRGIIATLTIKNTANIDILATNPTTGSFANIQVKTRATDNKQGWLLNRKAEERSSIANHFYVFVHLLEKAPPNYYIIPFNTFADYVRRRHEAWLGARGRRGHVRQDSAIRNFKPDGQDKVFATNYHDRWDLLGLF